MKPPWEDTFTKLIPTVRHRLRPRISPPCLTLFSCPDPCICPSCKDAIKNLPSPIPLGRPDAQARTHVTSTQRRPRRQRERQRTTTTLHVHHAFLYISRPVVARLQRETALRFVEDGNKDNNFLFFSRTLLWSFRIQLQKELPTFDELNEME